MIIWPSLIIRNLKVPTGHHHEQTRPQHELGKTHPYSLQAIIETVV